MRAALWWHLTTVSQELRCRSLTSICTVPTTHLATVGYVYTWTSWVAKVDRFDIPISMDTETGWISIGDTPVLEDHTSFRNSKQYGELSVKAVKFWKHSSYLVRKSLWYPMWWVTRANEVHIGRKFSVSFRVPWHYTCIMQHHFVAISMLEYHYQACFTLWLFSRQHDSLISVKPFTLRSSPLSSSSHVFRGCL